MIVGRMPDTGRPIFNGKTICPKILPKMIIGGYLNYEALCLVNGDMILSQLGL